MFDIACYMLVGARQAGLSILETAELLGHIIQSLLFSQHGAKKLPNYQNYQINRSPSLMQTHHCEQQFFRHKH